MTPPEPRGGEGLKPCPFCGGEAEEFTEEHGETSSLVGGHALQIYSKSTYFSIRCRRCDVGQTNPYVTRDYAIAAWNTRAPTAAARERDGLREALTFLEEERKREGVNLAHLKRAIAVQYAQALKQETQS